MRKSFSNSVVLVSKKSFKQKISPKIRIKLLRGMNFINSGGEEDPLCRTEGLYGLHARGIWEISYTKVIRYTPAMQAVQGRAPLGVLTIGAGHATILPHQCDHGFRPQSCWLMQFTIFVVATSSRHQDLNIFRIFSCPWGLLSRCRFVAL